MGLAHVSYHIAFLSGSSCHPILSRAAQLVCKNVSSRHQRSVRSAVAFSALVDAFVGTVLCVPNCPAAESPLSANTLCNGPASAGPFFLPRLSLRDAHDHISAVF